VNKFNALAKVCVDIFVGVLTGLGVAVAILSGGILLSFVVLLICPILILIILLATLVFTLVGSAMFCIGYPISAIKVVKILTQKLGKSKSRPAEPVKQ
jgi:hypothetical protein